MNVDYEDPDPALEFNLLECYPDNNYNIFYFDADSLYQLLINSPDSTELTINLDGDSSITILINNYSIYIDTLQDSTSFSKKGYVTGEPNSSVAGHFSANYFWIHILSDSIKVKISPVKMLGSNFANYDNLYVISFEDGEWNEDDMDPEDCSTYKIEVGVFVDPEGIYNFQDQFNVEGFVDLKTYIENQIIALEKFYNDEISEFNIELKLLKIEFLESFQTKSWNYNNISALNRGVDSEWNYPNCIKPDLYILYTGISQGGGHASPGICNPSLDEDPGLAVVPFRNSFGNSGSEDSGVTVFLAHEVSHLLGAGEGEDDCEEDCDDNPNCTPANLMCQFQCAASHAVKMNLFQCSINKLHNYLENRCESCFSSFSESECNFCYMKGQIRTADKLPLIKQCAKRDTINVYFTFSNDCDGRDVQIRAIYYPTVVERIGGLQDFTSEVIEELSATLYSPISYLDAGESITYSATFQLVDNPSGPGYFPNVPFQINVYSGGTQIFTYAPTEHFKYVKPEVISGNINLSDLVEPSSGYLFDSDNITGCTANNPPVYIDGILNIDQDYCLNNTWIIMGENSRIAIKDGSSLNINKDKILGCGSMWDAIEVEEGANLVVSESIIEDAMAAIRLEENTTFSSSETKYYNNLYGIIAPLIESGEIDFNVLAGNIFTADDTLTRYPLSGERPVAGIWLENVGEAFIHGEPPHTEPGMNVFSNMKNGIVLKNSDASIQNFHIYDIFNGSPKLIVPDEQPDGHGIYVHGSSDHFTTSIGSETTVDNYVKAQTGIFIKDANADIQYCNIRADVAAIILGYSNNREVNILNNLINAQYRGIQLRLPIAVTANISSNRITMPTENGIGIESLSSWQEVKIAENLIFMNSSREGISLIDSKSTYVEENRILFQDIEENQMKGIALESSSGNFIFDNTVIGMNKDHNTVGIYTQDSPTNTILCNTVKMANICYQFSGVNSLTNYRANNHLSSDFGLLLGTKAMGSDAIIGEQEHKQNLWPSTSYGEDGAWILSEDPLLPIMSRFYVDDSQSPYFPPNITSLISIDWFINAPTLEYSFDCQNFPIEFAEPCCNFSVPVDTIIDFETNPEVKDLHLRKQLYQALRDDLIDSMENLLLNQFYNISDTFSYGRLVDVRQLFEDASISSPGKKVTHIAEALLKNSEITDSEDYFVLEKDANDLFAEYIIDGDLEVLLEEEEDIRNVAALCPYEFGDGVYLNRAWLHAIDLTSGFDEVIICGAIEPRSSQTIDDSKLSNEKNQYHIWPNPAHVEELVNILSSQSISKIIVTDIIGREILEYIPGLVNEKNTQFDFNQSGWYIVTIWNELGHKDSFHQIIID